MDTKKIISQLDPILDRILEMCQSDVKVTSTPELSLLLKDIQGFKKNILQDNSGLSLVDVIGSTSPEDYVRKIVTKIEAIPDLISSQKHRASVDLQIGRIHYLLGDLNGASKRFKSALDIATTLTLNQKKADVCKRLGDVAFRQNRYDEAERWYKQGLEEYQSIEDMEGQAHLYNDLGSIAFYTGDWAHVNEWFGKCLALAEQINDTRLLAKVNNNLGACHNIQGKHKDSMARLRKALSHFQELEDDTGISEVYNNMGLCFARQGKWRHAGTCYEKSVQNAKIADNVHQMAVTYIQRAELCITMSNLKAAKDYSDRAIDCFLKVSSKMGLAEGYKLLGSIHREMHNFDVAETFLQKSLDLCKDLGNKLNEAETHVELAKLDREKGENEKADAVFQQAIQVFNSINAHDEAKKVKEIMLEEEALFDF